MPARYYASSYRKPETMLTFKEKLENEKKEEEIKVGFFFVIFSCVQSRDRTAPLTRAAQTHGAARHATAMGYDARKHCLSP